MNQEQIFITATIVLLFFVLVAIGSFHLHSLPSETGAYVFVSSPNSYPQKQAFPSQSKLPSQNEQAPVLYSATAEQSQISSASENNVISPILINDGFETTEKTSKRKRSEEEQVGNTEQSPQNGQYQQLFVNTAQADNAINTPLASSSPETSQNVVQEWNSLQQQNETNSLSNNTPTPSTDRSTNTTPNTSIHNPPNTSTDNQNIPRTSPSSEDKSVVSPPLAPALTQPLSFDARGIGGGGAMSGFSISPYNQNLWFVGTDMGTLFRSIDQGKAWIPVSDLETKYGADLSNSAPLGFSADGHTVFHAYDGKKPVRSADGGITWKPISLDSSVLIRYWVGHSFDENILFAATNDGLYKTTDKGTSWKKLATTSGESKGTFIDYAADVIYHANAAGIYSSSDGETFTLFHQAPIQWFSGGAGGVGSVSGEQRTLAYIDTDSSACTWGHHCGYVWVKRDSSSFLKTNQVGGKQILMAENNPLVMYVVGDPSWPNAYGTKVWISEDGGQSFTLRFHQYNWDVNPFTPWSADKFEYSAVALDVGFWDSGYYWFTVNPRNAKMAGGTQNFFLHVTKDGGNTWLSPFTKFADTGARLQNKKWQSTGLEVTSVRSLQFHPKNAMLGYAASADISGLVTEDGGKTWRILKTGYNTIYDVAFDADQNTLYAATGQSHDWPHGGWADYLPNGEGAILLSKDRGLQWEHLTPSSGEFRTQYLSVERDASGTIYAGTQGQGVAVKTAQGWEWRNAGLPTGAKIIPQIEINKKTGDVYILLSGDKPAFSNVDKTGIYKWSSQENKWVLLRGTVHAATNDPVWYYPTAFAIDFENTILYLADIENNVQWLATGIWRSIDNGKTWDRTLQFTFPYHILVDPNKPSRVYATGGYTADGSWGNGGSYYSDDFGKTWKKNSEPLKQSNLNSVTVDPNNPNAIFYTYFGGGMTYNPKP